MGLGPGLPLACKKSWWKLGEGPSGGPMRKQHSLQMDTPGYQHPGFHEGSWAAFQHPLPPYRAPRLVSLLNLTHVSFRQFLGPACFGGHQKLLLPNCNSLSLFFFTARVSSSLFIRQVLLKRPSALFPSLNNLSGGIQMTSSGFSFIWLVDFLIHALTCSKTCLLIALFVL